MNCSHGRRIGTCHCSEGLLAFDLFCVACWIGFAIYAAIILT